jgi:hypothetical protein
VRIATQADANEHVLNYMRRANRPYSIIMLEQNLLGAVPKKILEASLAALCADGSLVSPSRDMRAATPTLSAHACPHHAPAARALYPLIPHLRARNNPS